MTWPPLAIAATIIAFCIGVRRTSRCPIPDCCSEAVSGMSPSDDGTTVIGTESAVPIPNASACSRSFCSPSAPASSAKAVLHERASASRRVAVAPVPHGVPAKFSSVVFVLARVMVGAAVRGLSGV